MRNLNGINALQKYSSRFELLTRSLEQSDEDCRIKVAIIDNGVDKFGENVRDFIEKGISFVKIDSDDESRTLPWWMVSDPHGTQMASLIGDVNPFCRLYIARVGRGRKDILPSDAEEVSSFSSQCLFLSSFYWGLAYIQRCGLFYFIRKTHFLFR